MAGALFFPDFFHRANFDANFHWPPEAAPQGIAAAFSAWDAQHYLYLSRFGYAPGGVSNNFFPLWPALIDLTGGTWLSAALLSNAFSFFALLLFYRYAALRRGESAGQTALLLLLACPGALFFQFGYSESLFLLLCLLAFLFIERGRHEMAAGAVFLLTLCRPQGIMAAPAFWYVLTQTPVRRWKPAAWALAAAPLAGGAAYLLWMKASTGDAFDGFGVYRDYYPLAPSVRKLFDVPELLAALVDVRGAHAYLGSLLDRLWFVALLPALWLMARRDRSHFIYSACVGLIPAITLSFISYTRHFILAFPVFILAGELLSRENRRWPRRLILGAMAGIQAVLLIRHANNYWAG